MMGPGPGGRGRMSPNAQKLTKEERSHVLMKLGVYLAAETPFLALALIIMIVSSTFALFGPELSGDAIGAIENAFHNRITWDEAFETIKTKVILMVVLYVVSAAMSYGLSVLMLFISKRITYKMRKQLFSHLIELPVGFFDTNQVGDIISRMSYDIDTINASLSHDLLQIITSIYTVVFSLVMMIRTSIPLISIFVITVPVSIFFSNTEQKRFARSSASALRSSVR